MTLQFDISHEILYCILSFGIVAYCLAAWTIGRIKSGRRLDKLNNSNVGEFYYNYYKDEEKMEVALAPIYPFFIIIFFIFKSCFKILQYVFYPILKPFPQFKESQTQVKLKENIEEINDTMQEYFFEAYNGLNKKTESGPCPIKIKDLQKTIDKNDPCVKINTSGSHTRINDQEPLNPAPIQTQDSVPSMDRMDVKYFVDSKKVAESLDEMTTHVSYEAVNPNEALFSINPDAIGKGPINMEISPVDIPATIPVDGMIISTCNGPEWKSCSVDKVDEPLPIVNFSLSNNTSMSEMDIANDQKLIEKYLGKNSDKVDLDIISFIDKKLIEKYLGEDVDEPSQPVFLNSKNKLAVEFGFPTSPIAQKVDKKNVIYACGEMFPDGKRLENILAVTVSDKEILTLDLNNKVSINRKNGFVHEICHLLPNAKITKIASGLYHHLMLDDKGTVWEYTFRGQTVKICEDVTDIVAGDLCSFAIKKDGSIFKSGNNINGHLNFPVDFNNSIQIAVGKDHVAAINNNKHAIVYYRKSEFQYNSAHNFTQIACGDSHAVAIKEDQTLNGWGLNNYGNIVASNVTNIKKIACGPNYTVALKEDGIFLVWAEPKHVSYGEIDFLKNFKFPIKDINISRNNIFITTEE